MAVTLKPDPFSSVYVLDAHFQHSNSAMIDVFNSQAGRAVVQCGSPNKRKSPKNSHRRGSSDVSKLILNHDSDNGNPPSYHQDIRYPGWQSERNNFLCIVPCVSKKDSVAFEDSSLCDVIVDTDENRNIKSNAKLTRRIVGSKCSQDGNESKELLRSPDDSQQNDCDAFGTLESRDEDARINEKILRLKNHYERGFAADEKCDILRRMLTGFLSGLMFTKTKARSKWRKRKSSDDLYREASMVLGIPCEMTDSCRCLDCQCNYFDCGDTDSETSEISVNLNECDVEEWPPDTAPDTNNCDVIYYEDEVIKKAERRVETLADPPPKADSPYTCPAKQPDDRAPNQPNGGEVVIELPPSLEMAAGTPVVLDHLLSTPVSCTLQ